MAGEIATAFVRIRPNLAGFESETESGVTRAFRGIAEAVGVAFGAKEVFDFGKGAVQGAADLQHQIEGIRAEFGPASQQVIDFGKNAATSFGIAADTLDQTSNRFGILLQNLGIAPGLAGQMTVNLEKVAGSLATIRGVDPSQILSQLPAALLGNVRALKSMGLPIDATQIKLAALKLGLISTIKDGLTPAQKAIAVYSLATAHLGQLQDQAKQHAGDFTNVQARLNAEWKNAKDTLGEALLPQFTKLVTAAANWLERMQKTGALQRDFNSIARTTANIIQLVSRVLSTGWTIWQTVTGWIGGTKDAVIAFLAVLTVNKIRSIAGSLLTDLVNNGFKKVGAASEEAKTQAVQSFGTMGLAAKGLALTIKEALISTAIGALVVAIGIVTAYVITHWAQVKQYTINIAKDMGSIWHGFATEVIGEFQVIGGTIVTAIGAPLVGVATLAGKAFGWVPIVGGKIKHAANSVKDFLLQMGPGNIQKGLANIQKGGEQITATLYKAAQDAATKTQSDTATLDKLKGLGQTVGKTVGDGITTGLAGTPAKVATTVSDALKQAIAAAQQRIQQSITSAKDNLDKIGGKLATSVNQLLDKLGPQGPAGAAQKAAIDRLKKLIESGAPGFEITKAAQELSSNLQEAGKQNTQSKTAAHNAIKQQIADITDAFNSGKINLATFNKRLTDALRKDKVNYKAAGKELGSAFADGFQAEIKALREQAAAIAAVPAKLRGLGGGGGAADLKIIRPLEVIRRENQIIADKAAKQRAQQLKAQQRAATAAEKTTNILRQVKAVQVAPLPGKQSKKARGNAKSGVKP